MLNGDNHPVITALVGLDTHEIVRRVKDSSFSAIISWGIEFGIYEACECVRMESMMSFSLCRRLGRTHKMTYPRTVRVRNSHREAKR